MTSDTRYISNEEKFKSHAWDSLSDQFSNREDFETFYTSLNSNELKNDFLRVASLYHFLVKNGDWSVTSPHSDPIIFYFTNSYKLVGLLSLIESLSDLEYVDFYQWLNRWFKRQESPSIETKEALKNLYERYIEDYGASHRARKFFSILPDNIKADLKSSITIDGKPIDSIRKIADYLYNWRSKFVHETQLVLNIGTSTMLSMERNYVITSTLTIEKLLTAFEVGVLIYYRKKLTSPNKS